MNPKAKKINRLAERSDAGTRLDLFIVAKARDMSRKKAKKLIDTRRVSVDGRIESMASRTLKAGERIEVRLPDEEKTHAPTIEIIHDEPAFIAVAKGPGLPSGPTQDPKRLHAQKLAEAKLDTRLTLLHRIDRDTSGLLLMARDKEFTAALLDAFRTREVEKRYLAIVSGCPPQSFEDVCRLKEVSGGKVAVVRNGGMKAQTTFETLVSVGGASLVLAKPHTGRMHQLRAQLARRGYPVLGDSLYGGTASIRVGAAKSAKSGRAKSNRGKKGRERVSKFREVSVERQMLHAWKIAFVHPLTGERVELTCAPPADFIRTMTALFAKKAPKLDELAGF